MWISTHKPFFLLYLFFICYTLLNSTYISKVRCLLYRDVAKCDLHFFDVEIDHLNGTYISMILITMPTQYSAVMFEFESKEYTFRTKCIQNQFYIYIIYMYIILSSALKQSMTERTDIHTAKGLLYLALSLPCHSVPDCASRKVWMVPMGAEKMKLINLISYICAYSIVMEDIVLSGPSYNGEANIDFHMLLRQHSQILT